MTTLSHADNERLAGVYLVANTPLYLIQRFHRDDAVRRLAGCGATALIQRLRGALENEPAVLSNVVEAYALLIALTYFAPAEILPGLERLDLSRLDWAEDILKHYLDTFVGNSATSTTAPPLAPQLPSARHVSNTATTTFVPRETS